VTWRLAILWAVLTFVGVTLAKRAQWPLWGSALLAAGALGLVVAGAWVVRRMRRAR
jgi:hypothetical protein